MHSVIGPILLAIPLVLGACARQPEPAPAQRGMSSAAPPPLEPREAARAPEPVPAALAPAAAPSSLPGLGQGAFDQHCGECHRSDRKTAKPEALAIFDLTHEGWLSGMKASQLKGAIMRIKGTSKASEEERTAALSLLFAELARQEGDKPKG